MCSKWRAMTSGLLACLLMTLAGIASAHGASVGSLYIDHPYALPDTAVSNQWIIYFRGIKNEGTTPDRLTHASTPIAAEVIFQQALPPLGSDKFTTLTFIELPANTNTPRRRHPGEYRLLLKDLKQSIKDGDRFDLTLAFERAGTETVVVYVQSGQGGLSEDHKHK